jgi:sulfate transport system substrate-binding protein
MGAPADVAVMANEMDALKLRQAGLSSTYWRTFSHQGVVAYSPMVILVRRGNPRNIQDFGDLTIRGTKVIQSDPRRSGAGLWGVLAVHEGYLRGHHGDKRGAYYQLSGVWENTVSTPASAEEALRLFDTGFGDALITYEQEGLGAQDRGSSLEIVYPGNTVYAQHPVVIVDRNVSPEEKDLAREFVLFLWAENVQRSLVRHHFRAVTNEAYNAANSRFKPIAHPFTADSLGGWEKAYQDVAVKVWEQQVMRNSGK